MLNEPDPVRGSFLEALGKLPVAVFGEDWVPVLARLTTVVIEARDCSESTRRSLRILAGRTLRHQTSPGLQAWAFDVYRQLVARFGAEGLAGRPFLAGLSETSLREQIAGRQPPRPPAGLLAAARTLADRGDLAGGLVAVQIAGLVAASAALDASWLEVVTTLRGSAHGEVAENAGDIRSRKQGEEGP